MNLEQCCIPDVFNIHNAKISFSAYSAMTKIAGFIYLLRDIKACKTKEKKRILYTIDRNACIKYSNVILIQEIVN